MTSVKSHFLRTLHIIVIAVFMLLFTSGINGAEEPRFLKKSFPDGFTFKEPVTFYNEQDLYEYINGQAVFYLSYGFKRLEHGFYEKGEASYYADIYELDSRLSAFGSFRQQREAGAAVLGVGAEGIVTDYLATFYKDKYYIEIIPMSGDNGVVESMKLLAGHIDKAIPGAAELPPEMGIFPDEWLVSGSERYVDENLISYSFMGRGMVANYLPVKDEKEIKVFIALAGTDTNAKTIYDNYFKKLQNPHTVQISDIKGIKGKEPYRGITIISSWEGYVFGCLNVENELKTFDILNAILLNLKKYNENAKKQ